METAICQIWKKRRHKKKRKTNVASGGMRLRRGGCLWCCEHRSCPASSSHTALQQVRLTDRRMLPGLDPVLFVVTKDFSVKAGPPPESPSDDFNARAAVIGKLNNVRKIAFNPDGELFAVRCDDLYRGPMPSDANQDWFNIAKRVNKGKWSQFKFLLFDSQGFLYAVTQDGVLYKGPAPSDDSECWQCCQATKLGKWGWDYIEALFFDAEGILYAVTDYGSLVKRYPPADAEDNWIGESTTVGDEGWGDLTHFMAFSPKGDLWCVDSKDGKLYKGLAQTGTDYKAEAENLGEGYNLYPFIAFTTTKPR